MSKMSRRNPLCAVAPAIVLALAIFIVAGRAQAQLAQPSVGTTPRQPELVVEFAPGTGEHREDATVEGAGGRIDAEVEGLVQKVREAREKVEPDGAVMFDAHSCLPPPLVKQFAGYLKSDDLLFLEEAWVPGNIEVMRKLRADVPVPLATGERDRTIWEVREILEAQVIDILQPDCGHTGGISQVRKIAALAEAHYVPLAPHCTMSYLGLTASLHVAASIPFFLIHEGYEGMLPEGVVHKTWEMDAEGNVSLPEGPGLGVEVDEAKAREVGKDPAYRFAWPNARLPDGSVTDY